MARDQRERLQNIEEELEDVKKRLARIWNHIETTDTEMADASDRIREHRERKEKLEVAAKEARALLKERRQFLDSADTIAAFAAEMSEFLKTSELTETKAFVGSFVKEVVVKPGRAAIVYSIPTPDDSPIGGADVAEIALNGRVMNSVRHGGPKWTVDRTIFEMWLGGSVVLDTAIPTESSSLFGWRVRSSRADSRSSRPGFLSVMFCVSCVGCRAFPSDAHKRPSLVRSASWRPTRRSLS